MLISKLMSISVISTITQMKNLYDLIKLFRFMKHQIEILIAIDMEIEPAVDMMVTIGVRGITIWTLLVHM